MQPAAAKELAYDALRVDGRFGCGGGLIGGHAVRVGHHPGSGPVDERRMLRFLAARGRKMALGGALGHGKGVSRHAAKRKPARNRRTSSCREEARA